MPAEKKTIHRSGAPDTSVFGALCFALAFMVIGVCAGELARVVLMWLALVV